MRCMSLNNLIIQCMVLCGWRVYPGGWYHFVNNTLRPRQNGRHFPDYIFKRIFLNENFRILTKYHWNMFLRVPLKIWQYSDNGLASIRRQYIIWTHYGLPYWRIYASLGLNRFIHLRYANSLRRNDTLEINHLSYTHQLTNDSYGRQGITTTSKDDILEIPPIMCTKLDGFKLIYVIVKLCYVWHIIWVFFIQS